MWEGEGRGTKRTLFARGLPVAAGARRTPRLQDHSTGLGPQSQSHCCSSDRETRLPRAGGASSLPMAPIPPPDFTFIYKPSPSLMEGTWAFSLLRPRTGSTH